MSDLKVTRWHGDPDEAEQPDAGDVLAYCDPSSGVLNGPIMLVRHARPVRGRPEPHELMLVLEEGHVGHLGDARPEGGRVFTAHRMPRTRRRA